MAQRGDQPSRQGHGFALVFQGVAQDHELVCSQAGDGVGRPQDGTDAPGELDQEIVPGPVPQTGVYVLEAVDVDEGHGQQPGHPAETTEGAVEAVNQQGPVGQ